VSTFANVQYGAEFGVQWSGVPVVVNTAFGHGFTGFRKADYLAALQSLLPKGRAWPRDAASTLTRTLDGIAAIFEVTDYASRALLHDAFPSRAVALLPEWEQTLGLDPGASNDLDRQRAVAAALVDSGGQSKTYFISVAAALGVPITITEFRPGTVDGSVDEPLANDEWASAWRVSGPLSAAGPYTPTPWTDVVQSKPNPNTGNEALAVAFSKSKPAHTIVFTEYT
jgi:uncharacterized protein YmfQ (DUF2313 family)